MEEDNGFGIPVWSGSVEMSKEEEMQRLLKAAYITVDAGVAESSVLKAKHLGLFVEVLNYRHRLMDLDQTSVDTI